MAFFIVPIGTVLLAVKANSLLRSDPFQSDEHLLGGTCSQTERVFEYFNTSSIQCVAICHSDPECVDAAYDPETAACHGCKQNSDEVIYNMVDFGSLTSKYYVKRWRNALTCKDIRDMAPDLKMGVFVNKNGVELYCDMITEGGGWTVVQLRYDGFLNFNESWTSYKNGFGNAHFGEMWFGLEKVAELLHTPGRRFELLIQLTRRNGKTKDAIYQYFNISDESDHYRLHVGNYLGTAGDSLDGEFPGAYNGKRFTTFDSDSDNWPYGNCATEFGGGWWYDDCVGGLLNGDYYGAKGIWWQSWRSENLQGCSMKIREL